MNNVESFIFDDVKKLSSEVLISVGVLQNLSKINLFDKIRKNSVHLILTDTNVEKLYLASIIKQFTDNGFIIKPLIVEASEESKSLNIYTKLVEQSLEYGFDKYSVVFSLGGGIVNNLAGFLSSTLYRGIHLIHFPTSLLSQVDAAISFKQAINHKYGKNLIGSYHAPEKIIVDPSVLKTLELRFIQDGLAESIKHALCQSESFVDYLVDYKGSLYDIDFLEYVIKHSIELKMKVMDGDVVRLASDYNESIKHYGHTIGHAIEHLSEQTLYHGEAISIGMCVSAEIAYLLNLCDFNTLEKHYKIFSKYNLPTKVPSVYSDEELWDKIKYDKHFLDNKAYFGLPSSIGNMRHIDKFDDIFGHYITKNIVLKGVSNNRKRV